MAQPAAAVPMPQFTAGHRVHYDPIAGTFVTQSGQRAQLAEIDLPKLVEYVMENREEFIARTEWFKILNQMVQDLKNRTDQEQGNEDYLLNLHTAFAQVTGEHEQYLLQRVNELNAQLQKAAAGVSQESAEIVALRQEFLQMKNTINGMAAEIQRLRAQPPAPAPAGIPPMNAQAPVQAAAGVPPGFGSAQIYQML